MAFNLYLPGEQRNYPPYLTNSNRKLTVIDNWIENYPKSGKFFTRYLYSDLMDRLVEDCHNNIANEWDNCIVVQGREGTGKSSFSIKLAKALNPNFNMETDYIYSYEDMVKAVTEPGNKDIGRVFWLDETSSIMNNRDAMTNSSKNMVELLEMMRSRGWTLIMCIPSVERLDKYLRDYRIRYLITVEILAWDNVYKEESRGYWSLAFKWGDSYQTFRVIGYGKFDPMSEEEAAEYKAIKLRSQQIKLDEIAGRDRELNKYDKAQAKLQDAFLTMFENGITQDDLAEKYGYAKESVVQMISTARARRRQNEGDDIELKFGANEDLIDQNTGRKKVEKTQNKLGNAFLALYEKGTSQEELAEQYGYKIHTVRQMISDARKRREELA